MKKVDFDDYADEYAKLLEKQLCFFDENADYFAMHKTSLVHRLIRHSPNRILEFGCGVGTNIRHLAIAFPDAALYGCDVSKKSLEVAAQKNPTAEFFCPNSNPTAYKGRFDLVFIANVFHHITSKQRLETLHRVRQLMSDNGELFIFEHNPYNPVTRHIVKSCPFDADAQLLKPKELVSLLSRAEFSIIQKHFILFFPSFLGKLRPLERYLVRVPFGGQYVIHAAL
jgi:SAM-dependent methyltransferase